jgi:AraC family transcriptional regulator
VAASAPSSTDAATARGLRTLIHRNLDARLGLARLATHAGMSTFRTHRLFQAEAGVPPARYVLLLRLKRASMRLAFEARRSITDIAFEAGYANAESFSRAFRRCLGQSPSAFRAAPEWLRWRTVFGFQTTTEANRGHAAMNVEIVDFPETRVAAIEHLGSTANVYDSTRRLIEWRIANRVPPQGHATYGVHHDLRTHADAGYRMDVCVAYDREVAPNPQGVVARVIPGGRCARVRHVGSREFIPVVQPLFTEWLPGSGETLRDFPVFFHYVNVGPGVQDHEMITDVYLPLA